MDNPKEVVCTQAKMQARTFGMAWPGLCQLQTLFIFLLPLGS